MLHNLLPQPEIALLRAIALKAAAIAHILHRFYHGSAAGFGQGLGDIANPQLDDGGVGIGFRKGTHPPGNFGKQVPGLELKIVVVNSGHDGLI